MELKYTITRKEYIKTLRFAHSFNLLLLFYFFYVLHFFCIFWYFYNIKTAIILLPVWAVLFYFIMLKPTFNAAEQLIPAKERFDGSVFAGEDSLTFSIGGLSMIIPYETINKISSTASFVLISAKAGVFYIPRAAFGGAEQEEGFISMLKERVGNV